MENKLSVFKAPITNVTPLKSVTINDIHKVITSPKKYQSLTEQLRSITSKKEAGKFKMTAFDYTTFSGEFSKREDAALIEHSGLICIDIDKLGDVTTTREAILSSDFKPALLFVSPSGNGLKVVYRISIDQSDHLSYFKAIRAYFDQEYNITIDPSGKDVSRACFLPYDPDCYFNGNPSVLDISFVDTFTPESPTGQQITKTIPATNGSYTNKIGTAIKMVEVAPDGEKHNELIKASRLMGGYIASGEVNEQEVISALENAIQGRDIDDFKTAQKTIRDGIEHGKKDPIYSTHQKNVQYGKKESNEPIPLLPIDGLPEFLQQLITKCAEVYGTHRDFWAAGFLSATALGIGQTHQLKGKYNNAAVLWMAVVAPSGIGKTEPVSFALTPFHKLDTDNIKEFEKEYSEYETVKAMSKKERNEAGIDVVPDFPICHQYILSDTTPEAVASVHNNNPRGILIHRDELHGWLLDFGRYAKSGEVQNWLSSWSQQPWTVNRKGNAAPLKIPQPFINVIGGLQPDIIPELAKEHRAVNGFMQRFCFIFPDDVKRPHYRNEQIPEQLKQGYNEYIRNLLGLIGDSDPVCLSIEGQKLYTHFVNDNADQINSATCDYLQAMYAKLDIVCLRLALVVHFSKWACTGIEEPNITPDTMQAAIDITEYFRATGKKVYHHLAIDAGAVVDNKTIAKYLRNRGASQNEIAAAMKVSQQYVQKILK